MEISPFCALGEDPFALGRVALVRPIERSRTSNSSVAGYTRKVQHWREGQMVQGWAAAMATQPTGPSLAVPLRIALAHCRAEGSCCAAEINRREVAQHTWSDTAIPVRSR
jgi:hypothetical protein